MALCGHHMLASAVSRIRASAFRVSSCGVRFGSSAGDKGGTYHGSSLALHADGGPAAEMNRLFSTDYDIAPPLSVTTTFEHGDGHIYSRMTAPTRERCERVLGAVEGLPGKPAQCVLYSSGLAACFAAIAHFQPKRVLISGGYHGTHLVISLLKRISAGPPEVADLLPPDQVQAGDLVWIETPINPTCDVTDIAAYADAAAALRAKDPNAVARVVVDGTFAPPPLQRPLTLGVDCVMHSATKYLAGHSDALCGALCVDDPSIATALRNDRTALGSQPGSLETWLLLRSLRTLHVRVERQARSAAAVASFLHDATVDSSHPLYGYVRSVRHPSLPSDPGHEIAKRQMSLGLYGGCFALELMTENAAKNLYTELELFKNATSLGGVESLIEWRRQYDDAISPYLLRVSVGLEEPADLQADMQRAILAVGK